jgi:hypothetical protein
MQTRQQMLDRIAQLEDLLGLSAAVPIAALLQKRGVARQDAKILGMLVRRPFVANEVAYDALYGDLPETKRPEQYASRRSIKRIRRALEGTGIEINNAWGEGYFISAQDKQKLLTMWPELADYQQKRAA